MEPTNHPFRKENDLPNLHDYVLAVNLPGCNTSNFFCNAESNLSPLISRFMPLHLINFRGSGFGDWAFKKLDGFFWLGLCCLTLVSEVQSVAGLFLLKCKSVFVAGLRIQE